MLFGLLVLLSVVLGIASFVGFILLTIQAFRSSAAWGVLVLLLSPIAALVYAIRNWDEARRPFLVYGCSFVGSCLCVVLALAAGVGAAVTSASAEMERAPLEHSMEPETASIADRVERPSPSLERDPALPAVEVALLDAAAVDRPADERVESAEPAEPAEPLTVMADGPEAPADDRTRRTLARADAPADYDPDAVPAGYTVVSFNEAQGYVGRRVRVLDGDGTLHEGLLSHADGGRLTLERDLGGGTVSYELNSRDVRSVQVYYR
jgi:hypothetical protein